MLPVQVRLPLLLVIVHPVPGPLPPASRTSPVDTPPIKTWPDVEPFKIRSWAVPPEARVIALDPVMLPMATRLPDESILWVPAPAPVFIPVVALIVPPVIVPVVVMLSVPTSIGPKPEVILPALRTPVPMIAVATASFVSISTASLPSSLLSSVAVIVTPSKTIVERSLPVRVSVPVTFPIEVAELPDVLILAAAPLIAKPALPVSSPALVIVALPVVDILPEHVKLPVTPSTVQPVFPEPPAKLMLVAVLLPGPMLIAVVAPPPKLIVVAVVLKRLTEVALVATVAALRLIAALLPAWTVTELFALVLPIVVLWA